MPSSDISCLPPYSPKSTASCDFLPEYLPKDPCPAYLLHTPPECDYLLASKNVSLSLGPNPAGALPVYGRQSVIQGRVNITDLDAIHKITVSVTGTVSIALSEKCPSPRNRRKESVLQNTMRLWSADNAYIPLSDSYLFSIELPANASNSDSPLPPTTSIRHQNYRIRIKYKITARVVYRGMRKDENVSTEFLYLPQSKPRAPLPLLPTFGPAYEKSETILSGSDLRWDVIQVRSKSTGQTPSVQLCLPQPLSFASSKPIPFRILFPSLSLLESSDIVINLVKRTTIVMGTRQLKFDSIVGNVPIFKITQESGSTRCRIAGELQVDQSSREASWRLADTLEFQYFVSLRIRSLSGGPSFECRQLVHLATHTASEFVSRSHTWSPPLAITVSETKIDSKPSGRKKWFKSLSLP